MDFAEYTIASVRGMPMVTFRTMEVIPARDAAEAVWKYLEDQRARGVDLRGRCLLIKLEDYV